MANRFDVPGRFNVEAVTRTPRLSDYQSSTHKYLDRYIKPSSYTITVDAFPGKRLETPRGDQQIPSGTNPKDVKDIWRLKCPPGTSGWEFKLEGKYRVSPIGPGTTVKLEGRRPLPAITGVFGDEGDYNAWNWDFSVPGPGIYDITVNVLGVNAAVLSSRSHRIVLRDYLVVSIGDSAASGEGNPDLPGRPEGYDPDLALWEKIILPVAVYKLTVEALDWLHNRMQRAFSTLALRYEWTIDMDPSPKWSEPEAHRSLVSAPAVAAASLEDRAEGTVVTHLAFGRSGSTIPNGLIGPRDTGDAWIGGIGQIQEAANVLGNRRIDALLIYIGVNDVGVSGTLRNLVSGDLIIEGHGGDDTAARLDAEAKARVNLSTFPQRFKDLEEELAKRLNVRHVYIIEYPTGLFNNSNGDPSSGCGAFSSEFDLDITPRDAATVRDIGDSLNLALQKEVRSRRTRGWFYVGGIATSFKKRGYCTANSCFIGAEESLGIQGDTRGTIHPNSAGIKKIALAISNTVRRNRSLTDGAVTTDDGGVVLGAPATTGGRAAGTQQPVTR